MNRCRALLAIVVALLVASSSVVVQAAESSASGFREVDRLPLFTEGSPAVNGATADFSGWLVLNPVTRRGYQVFETNSTTVLQSFDLDTLAPRRRVQLQGIPVTGGADGAASGGGTLGVGELVHAVDDAAGRIYLAMSEPVSAGSAWSGTARTSDARRGLARLVMIDEAAFDRGDAAYAASFKVPASQAHLHSHSIMGMTVTRHHVGAQDAGRLLVAFAHSMPMSFPGPYDHWLVQWNPAGLRRTAGDGALTGLTTTATVAEDWQVLLAACAAAPMTGDGSFGHGGYQWGVLATVDAVWLGCRTRPRTPVAVVGGGGNPADHDGAAVRVELDADGRVTSPARMEAYSMTMRVSDVLVDQGAERLLFRTFVDGHTLRPFDTRTRRFGGAIDVKRGESNVALALGVDGTTGRLYALLPDYAFHSTAVQGGLQYADTRAAATTALANLRPELDYPAQYRIQVDPVTQRFFVRRGSGVFRLKADYPGIEYTTPAPIEPFYRVFQDRVKVP